MKTYIQITGGRGPVECARAVKLVSSELLKANNGLQLAYYESHNTEPDCFMSITFHTEDEAVALRLRSEWEGTILWVATKNPFRPGYKRKNWFVGVHLFTEAETIAIKEEDIRYVSTRSGGHGGQNVNKVETAVRAVHIPTGISVRCEEERFQLQNRIRARERLILKVSLLNQSRKAENEHDAWSNHNNIERGNPKKTFRGSL